MNRFLVIVALILIPFILYAETITGKVVSVSDGDTITVLVINQTTNTTVKIRLSEIDCPEKKQAFGTQAKKALSEKIFGKMVAVEYNNTDRYGRIIGKIIFDGRWINKEMIEEGFSWHYKQYSSNKELAKAELIAKEKKLGLWVDKNPVPPWEFRRKKPSEISNK